MYTHIHAHTGNEVLGISQWVAQSVQRDNVWVKLSVRYGKRWSQDCIEASMSKKCLVYRAWENIEGFWIGAWYDET